MNKLKPGIKARIVRITGAGGVRKRIVDMGMTPGTVVEVERVAPLGDPIAVRVKRYRLVLRKAEASRIAVQLL
ncbi:MAG: ferrous iron transport protein A [Candidatus Krumholzibacteriia bacterium]